MEVVGYNSTYLSENKPSFLLSDKQKLDKKFGLSEAKRIYGTWQKDTAVFGQDFRTLVDELRDIARGTESIERYKSVIKGQNEFMNISWIISPVIPTYVDVIRNRLLQQNQKVIVRAIDPLSEDIKKKERYAKKINLKEKPFLKDIKNATGLDLMQESEFESEEQIDLYFDLTYKTAAEMALELGVELITSFNDFEDIKSKCLDDFITIGRSCTRTLTTPNGIKIVYEDPRNVITDYSELKNRKDCNFFGVVRKKRLRDIVLESNKDITVEEAIKIYQMSKSEHNQPIPQSLNTSPERMSGYFDSIKDEMVDVLEFEIKTLEDCSHVERNDKFGRKKLIKYDYVNDVKNEDNIIKAEVEELYTGSYIVGTEFIYNWGKSTNVARPKGRWYNAMSTFQYMQVMGDYYTLDSIVQRCKGFNEQIQISLFKLQHLVSKAKPMGAAMDATSMEGLSKSGGGVYSLLDISDIYHATGDIYYRGQDEDGSMLSYRPITEMEGGIGRNLIEIQNIVRFNIDMIESTTGIPQIAKGQSPSRDALVGVQEIAVNASYNATDHIRQGIVSLFKQIARSVVLRISDALKYNEDKKYFESALGNKTVLLLENIKDIINIDVDIDIEVEPTEKEIFEFKQALLEAEKMGTIDADDRLEILELRNLKYARRVLKIRKMQKAERMAEQERAKMEQLAQQQQQSASMAAEARALEKRLELEVEIEAEKEKAKIKEDLAAKEHEREKEIIELKSKMKREELEVATSDRSQGGKAGGTYGADRNDVVANARRVQIR